jgi:hypothetical protein
LLLEYFGLISEFVSFGESKENNSGAKEIKKLFKCGALLFTVGRQQLLAKESIKMLDNGLWLNKWMIFGHENKTSL